MGNATSFDYAQPDGSVFKVSFGQRVAQFMGCSKMTLEQYTALNSKKEMEITRQDGHLIRMYETQLASVILDLDKLKKKFEPRIAEANKSADPRMAKIQINGMAEQVEMHKRRMLSLQFRINKTQIKSDMKRDLHQQQFARRQEMVWSGAQNIKDVVAETKRLYIEQAKELEELDKSQQIMEMQDANAEELLDAYLAQDEKDIFEMSEDELIMKSTRTGSNKEASDRLLSALRSLPPPPKSSMDMDAQVPEENKFVAGSFRNAV